MKRMLDLFSGIGGFSLAGKWTGGIKTIAFCEIDKFCQKVLNKNFPGIPIFDDIKNLKGDEFGAVDIITGGFPCQDISSAGKRKGLRGEKTGLFFEMLRIIEETKPKWIIYENSPLIVNNGLNEIHKNLKRIGYVNIGFKISAREFGFPHKRIRYYGVSVADSNGLGWNALEIFIREFYKIKQSEIQLQTRKNKTKFSGTFSDSLCTPTNSDILRGFNGVPSELYRNRIKALGNAIVPQIAYIILKSILEIKEM
jgi:DNA (cytosine-5)-methyltransferase 1